MDQNTKLIGAGVTGALVSMLCCVTPVLVVLLAALGLTAWVAKLETCSSRGSWPRSESCSSRWCAVSVRAPPRRRKLRNADQSN